MAQSRADFAVSHTALSLLLCSFWAHVSTWGLGNFLSHPVNQRAQKSPESRWGQLDGEESILKPKERRHGKRRAEMRGSIEWMVLALTGINERFYINTVESASYCSEPEHKQKEDTKEHFPSKNRKGKMKQSKNKTKKHKTHPYTQSSWWSFSAK